MSEQLHSDRDEANTLNPVLLDQLAWIFAQVALENFLREHQANAVPASTAVVAGCEPVLAIRGGGEIDSQARRR